MTWRGLSPSTIRKRSGLAARFLRHVGPGWPTAEPADVLEWLGTTRQSPDSMAGTLSNLHAFYVWAMDAGHASSDPTAAIQRPKLSKRMPRPIPERDYQLVLMSTEHPVVRAWLLLAGMGGLRCIELGRLRWDDIDLGANPPAVRVLGKGNRPRTVPLHPMVCDHLADMARAGPWLNGARPASGASVSQRIGQAMRRVGVRASAHQLRHRAATEAYRATRNLLAVQRLLGHSTVATTEVYTQLVDGEVAAAVRAIPPPGNGGTIHPGSAGGPGGRPADALTGWHRGGDRTPL